MALYALSGNLTVGQTCKYDMQCTGTEYASVCNKGQCECQSEYIRNGTNCYPGKGIFFFFNTSICAIFNTNIQ